MTVIIVCVQCRRRPVTEQLATHRVCKYDFLVIVELLLVYFLTIFFFSLNHCLSRVYIELECLQNETAATHSVLSKMFSQVASESFSCFSELNSS